MDELKDKLLPCPFCGGEIGFMVGEQQDEFAIGCNNEECDVEPLTKIYSSEEKAIKAWNRRHLDG